MNIMNELSQILKNSIQDIILSQDNFDKLPRDSKGVCNYYGPLSLTLSGIKKLPENFTVHGYFYCSNNNIEELPSGLIVNGEFNCYHNRIKELPKDLVVNGDLYCFNNLLEDIPESVICTGTIFCYGNNMNIFRITDNNTKRILRGEDIPKNTLPATVDLSEDEKLEKEEKEAKEKLEKEEKEAKEKLEKEEKEAEEKRLEEEKMANMSDHHREIYIRVTAIKKKRKNMTVSRYSHYENYYW